MMILRKRGPMRQAPYVSSECKTYLALLRDVTFTLSRSEVHDGCVDGRGSTIGVPVDAFMEDLRDVGLSSGVRV